jgi:putative SOS response-associated peptidase YedK
MCGRFVQERSVTELAELFEAEPLAAAIEELATPRYNLAPTDPAAVVVERIDGRRAIAAYRWGLIPHWATSAREAARTINARAETVATTPAFREAFRRRRCLVPSNGFYEWSIVDGRRVPFLIRNRDGSPLVFAGLWAGWRDPTSGESRRTFTIVTTTAGDAIRPLHDRMPVALAREDWATWLDPESADPVALRVILERATDAGLEMQRVSPLVNSVRNQGPDLIEPLAV